MNHATEPALGWDASNKTTQLALRQPALDTDEQWCRVPYYLTSIPN